jgi:hypothetical protein
MKNHRGACNGIGAIAILLAACCFVLPPRPGRTATTVEPLRLSAMPPVAHVGRPPHGRQDGSQAHGGHGSMPRPQPVHTYWLDTCQISDGAEAYVTRPEGEVEKLTIERKGHEVKMSARTPMGDGLAHGANTIYLIDRYVEQGTLVMATAKLLIIHHSCGWGHDHKFNPARMHPQPFVRAPLEIVVEGLWDENFHSNVMSGDQISFRVLSYGKPATGASVLIESEKGWQKRLVVDREGRGSFQLVRDYYPGAWQVFDRRKSGSFKMTATYETAEKGRYEGVAYEREMMNSTFAWHYYPARQEYASYAYGLLLATFSMAIVGFGVYSFRERRRKPYQSVIFDE